MPSLHVYPTPMLAFEDLVDKLITSSHSTWKTLLGTKSFTTMSKYCILRSPAVVPLWADFGNNTHTKALRLIAVCIQSPQLFGHLNNIHLIGILCLWDYSEESCRSHINAVVQLIHFKVSILGGVVKHFIGGLICVISGSHWLVRTQLINLLWYLLYCMPCLLHHVPQMCASCW